MYVTDNEITGVRKAWLIYGWLRLAWLFKEEAWGQQRLADYAVIASPS